MSTSHKPDPAWHVTVYAPDGTKYKGTMTSLQFRPANPPHRPTMTVDAGHVVTVPLRTKKIQKKRKRGKKK